MLYFCIEKQIEALKNREVKLNVYVKGCSFHLLKKNVYHSGPPLPPPPHIEILEIHNLKERVSSF
jgi:hypothetical protein